MKDPQVLFYLELLLRIFLASIFGLVIGYERSNRRKEAGMRTHMLVAMGSALIMIVSKYGFDDILGMNGIALDPSRIAAQVVSGVGFLGAGMIFVRRQNIVSGLTTAAGIWATSGMGIAMGAGMYIIAIPSALFIVFAQIILHTQFVSQKEVVGEELTIHLRKEKGALEKLKQQLQDDQFDITSLRIEDQEEDYCVIVQMKVMEKTHSMEFLEFLKENKAISSIEY